MAKFKRKVRLPGGLATEGDQVEKLQLTFTSQRQTILNSLLTSGAIDDPVLLSILQELTDELSRVATIIDPAPTVVTKPPDAGSSGKPSIPTDFRYTLTELNVILAWTLTSSEYTFFELRKGTIWNTADKLLVTNNASVILNPLLYGTHTYLLKALSTLGVYSDELLSLEINIPIIGAVSITPIVAANAVTLSWTTPATTWKIDYYKVIKDGFQIALASGTFFAVSEEASGTHIYGIIPVDIAGNEGPQSTVSVVTTGITDYVFYAKLKSNLNGIAINGYKADNALYFCVNASWTYEEHFINYVWDSPQAQVNAGYAPWLSPFATDGSYEETFDFGQTIQSTVVSVNWLYQLIYGNFTFGWQIQTSPDGTNWSPIQTVPSFYATQVRYVKVKMLFTGENDLSLLKFTELTVSLNVKRENDGGYGVALASDPNGTVMRFNKATPNLPVFVDIESITITPITNFATFSTYEFVDIPFPQSFAVRVYDNAGVRITCDVRWAARGIV